MEGNFNSTYYIVQLYSRTGILNDIKDEKKKKTLILLLIKINNEFSQQDEGNLERK